nr:mannosyl-oligosaccharide alpha-1,2-mannosidase [Quercus suber]
MFEKEDAVRQILRYITNELDLKVVVGGTKIQVFEVTIRHFAGMISAWDLLDGPFSHIAKDTVLRQGLYDQMVNLGDILSCAFNTPSGVPRDWLDPAACQSDQGTSNTIAGAGTLILEFARLSDITKDKKYVNLAQRAEDYLLHPKPSSHEPYPGLLGSYVSVGNGELLDSRGSWGAFADSYIYDSDRYGFYLERWLVAADSTIQSIGSHPYGHPEWTMLSSWDGSNLHQQMESLSWFAGGNFILGGMVTDNQTLVDYGLSMADAAGAIYAMTATGLGPEFVTWTINCDAGKTCDPNKSIQISDGKYRLRPEVLETWYHAYRATKDPKYREWSWSAFQAINRYCRTDSGFSAISNVNAADGGSKTDVQESFVFAEVMKYVYLTHLEDENAPFQVQDSRTGTKNTWVFNTEAHPLRVVGPPK